MEKIPLTNLQTNKKVIINNSFTKDQSKAYDDLSYWINSKYDKKDYKRALIGPAGTGKTFLIRAIISNCKFSYSKIGLAAPTHKAVRVLRNSIIDIPCNCNTLQSDLGLRLNLQSDNFDVNNPPFDPKGRIKVSEYSLYIVDEASMINRSYMELLERICLQSGVKLIVMGDDSQLAPVNESYSSAFRNIKSNVLKQIVRQDDSNPVKKLLNMLRMDIKMKTFNFLNYISTHKYETDEGNTKGFYICNTEEFNRAVIMNFNDEEFTKNINLCRIVAYTNKQVTMWNSFVRNSIIKDSNKSVITKNDLILSYVTIVDDFLSPIITNCEEYVIKDIINYVHPRYELKGFMITFTSIYGGINTKPLFVVDHTDINNITKYVAITKKFIEDGKRYGSSSWKNYYEFKNEVLLITNILSSNQRILYSRDLDYGFAITAHKSQGSTFENVLVDVNDIVYDANGRPYVDAQEINRRLYVACSRCKNKLYLRYGR